MKKNLSLLSTATALLFLAGCGAPVGLGISESVGIYATKPSDPPPADIAGQMPQHESWCYSTMGESVECYAEPQDTPPGRLVNVEPPNRYPLTSRAYADVVEQNRLAHAPKEPPKPSAEPAAGIVVPPVQPAELVPLTPPQVELKPAPAPKAAATQKAKKHKKKSKKPMKPKKPADPNAPPPATDKK